MKKIVFSHSFSAGLKGHCINFSDNKTASDINKNIELEIIEMASLSHHFGNEWLEQFSAWMGQLNCNYAGLFWWAHTATAKNILSSSLGQRYFQVRAVCEIVKQKEVDTLHVIGATPGQMATISTLLPSTEFLCSGRAWQLKRWNKIVDNIRSLAKQWIHLGSVWSGFLKYRLPRLDTSPDLCLFTYIDGTLRDGVDNYFGKLPEILHTNNKPLNAVYLAYVYRPYWKKLKQISKERDTTPYVALYGFLRLKDYFWALLKSMLEWRLNFNIEKNTDQVSSSVYSSILREALVYEIGGYFHNLLVHRAICSFMTKYTPKVIVYPYENKSLEKMILLGISKLQQHVKVVGYQHTSVTPKHSTLLFRPGEAVCTPLPHQIITVGQITRNYLEKFGNYPSGIFITGGALRQVWSEQLPQQKIEKIRVLLALSSSKEELIQSIEVFKVVMQNLPGIELGIRPHINFPLTLLTPVLATWVNENALNLTGTLLQNNLTWCSVTAYVSSTVALETLMRGKPVVNLSIGDMVSSDPLMGDVPFHWRVNNHVEMADVLIKIHQIMEREYLKESLCAVNYVRNYLAPVNQLCLKNFRDVLCNEEC